MTDEPTRSLRAADYFVAVHGLAMVRSLMSRPADVRRRTDAIASIIAGIDAFPNSLEIPVTEYAVEAGYARWAPRYDGPNPAIAVEEPIVHGVLAALPPGTALDAACGTGRHASALASLGHRVVAVDTTEAMLDIARTKVPGADFRRGDLAALPVEDASIDVLTCALALEHVEDIGPVFREFGRVLKPGGHAVISDMHPVWRTTGGVAGFPTDDGKPGVPYVTGFTHQASDYIAAFLAAGFAMRACIEPRIAEPDLGLFPTFRTYPDATRDAFLGLPFVIIWHLVR
jgi:ubiquinone/menaquinone biosynthesis C-methylase UbiE